MTNAVTVKNITFQEGETLICVPLIGKTLDEILGNAHGLSMPALILSNGALTTLPRSERWPR